MARRFKTCDVAKLFFSNHLKKAKECFSAAQNSLHEGAWNAAVINSIHCCIAACDAMCVYFLGKRNAGDDHNSSATLFKTIKADDEINENANRILRILRVKNMAEYEERLVSKSEAEKIFKDCERFLEFVEKQLPA